jgi:MFS transporter, DHA1 family, putative efflux transporter
MAEPASARPIHVTAELATAWITLFVIGTDLFVMSPLLPLIARDYHVSPSTSGLTVTAFAFSYMLSAPLLGHLADRIGRRRVLSGCLFGFAAANLLSASAGTLLALIAARIVAGGMAAGVTPSLYALVGDTAPPGQRGIWLATAVSGLLLSLSLGAPLGGLAGARFGWPSVFVAFAALSLALLWLNRWVWPPPAAAPAGDALAAPGSAAPRLLLTVLWSTALYAVYTYLGAGLAAAGFSTERAATVILLYGLGAVAGNLMGGSLADRLGYRAVTGAGLLGIALGFLVLPAALPSELLIGPAFAAASAAAQLFFPAQQAGLSADFPTRRAAVLAWNNAALFLGISLGSIIGGAAIARGGFGADLAVAAAIALTAWLLHLTLGSGRARAAAGGGA